MKKLLLRLLNLEIQRDHRRHLKVQPGSERWGVEWYIKGTTSGLEHHYRIWRFARWDHHLILWRAG